jgi:hypothetical protein
VIPIAGAACMAIAGEQNYDEAVWQRLNCKVDCSMVVTLRSELLDVTELQSEKLKLISFRI